MKIKDPFTIAVLCDLVIKFFQNLLYDGPE